MSQTDLGTLYSQSSLDSQLPLFSPDDILTDLARELSTRVCPSPDLAAATSGGSRFPQGRHPAHFAHVSSSQAKTTVKKEDQVAEAGGEVDLSDLMAQLQAAQK